MKYVIAPIGDGIVIASLDSRTRSMLWGRLPDSIILVSIDVEFQASYYERAEAIERGLPFPDFEIDEWVVESRPEEYGLLNHRRVALSLRQEDGKPDLPEWWARFVTLDGRMTPSIQVKNLLEMHDD